MLDIPLIIRRRELLMNLVVRTLKVRYKSSALGFLWTLISPLAMMIIYYAFLKYIISSRGLWIDSLLTGVIFWQFIVMCTGDTPHAVSGYSNLVKRTYFPRIILPLSTVIANLINYILSLIVLFVILLITGMYHGGANILWAVPLAVGLQFLLVMGLGFILSGLNVFFRDVEHIVGVATMALFFLSPIIYPLSMVLEKVEEGVVADWIYKVYLLNPIASLVTLFRKGFLGTDLPKETTFWVSLGLCVVIFEVGILIFNRLEPYFADEL